MAAAPQRNFFQFSMIQMLALSTLAACEFALIGYPLNSWREQNREHERAEKMKGLILRYGGHWGGGQSVNFAGVHLSKPQLDKLLSELKAFEGLTSIDISDSEFDDSHIRFVVSHRDLVWINLANTLVTDNGLRELAKQQELIWINVDNDRITDKSLAELEKLTNLQHLNVRGTKVTTQGIEDLKWRLPEIEVLETW